MIASLVVQTDIEYGLDWRYILVIASITAVVEAFLSIGVSYALFKFYVKDIE
jgi:hypothetical protein